MSDSSAASSSSRSDTRTVVLDLDGTLVDSVYLHVRAWLHAFHEVGVDVPSHRVHAAIGMGGDRLVGWVAGEAAEDSLGDRLRDRHRELFLSMVGDVRPTRGARELLVGLRDRSLEPVLASSSDATMTEELLRAGEVEDLLSEVLTGDQSERSKPHPEPVAKVLERTGTGAVLMIGDAPWDAEAAGAAGVRCVGVRTGGFVDHTLLQAGCSDVFEDPQDLLDHLDALLG